MADIDEAVSEAVERGAESRLNAAVAILVALTATFMALAGVKDGNIGQAMAQAQARAVDTWSYYQAKSTKENLAEATIDQLTALRDLPRSTPEERASLDRSIATYQAKIAHYEKDNATIKAQAEGYEKEYERLNSHDDQFDLADAALSVSIALFGITALTQKRWLLFVGIVFMLFGVFFGIAGFLSWTVHPDAMMNWLS